MALSAKERQKRYRAKQREKHGYRLDMIVSLTTDAHLEILSLHGNMTKKQLIEKLIDDEFVRRVNADDSFNKLIDEQSRATLNDDTPILPPSEPSDIAETVTDTNPPPKPKPPKKRKRKAVAEKPDPETLRCDKTPDMFDNDWRKHGLNDCQIAKIKSDIYTFGDKNIEHFDQFLQNGENYMMAFKHIEPLLKDPKTINKYHGIDEILSKWPIQKTNPSQC